MVKAGPSPNYLGTLSSRESHVTENSSEDYRRLLPDRVAGRRRGAGCDRQRAGRAPRRGRHGHQYPRVAETLCVRIHGVPHRNGGAAGDDGTPLRAAETGRSNHRASCARLRLGGCHDQDRGPRILLRAAPRAGWRRVLDGVRRESAAGIGVAAGQNQQSDCKYGAGLPGNQYVPTGLSDREVDVSAAISGRRVDRQWSRVAGLLLSRTRVSALLLSDRTRDAQRLVDERVACGEWLGRATLAG